MPDWGLSEIVAVVSAVIAAFSVLMNIRVVSRQIALQSEEVRATVDAEKSAWLGETLEVFADAEAACLWNPAEAARSGDHLRLAQRFSILADKGRISFPNLRPDDRGANNPEAYQGLRQPAINAVILAHDLMQALPSIAETPGERLQSVLFECRRVLVSEVQRSVDPRRREQALRAQFRRSKKDRDAGRGNVGKIMKEMRALKIKLSFN